MVLAAIVQRQSWTSLALLPLSPVHREKIISVGTSRQIILPTTNLTLFRAHALDDATLSKLSNLDVVHQVRHLKVGDYVWVARERHSGRELVLPYIIERKRMDDFGASIKDGRYREQKFRLKQCGLQTVIYLIESLGNNAYAGLPLSTLYQAAINTLIHDCFDVKFTNGLNGTVEYLGCLTRLFVKLFKDKTLVSCPKQNLVKVKVAEDDLVSLMTFKEFNAGAAKQKVSVHLNLSSC